MTDSDPVTATTAALRTAGCVFAEDEARLIHAEATGPDDVRRLLDARVAGRPLEQVLGWAALDGLRIALAPGVFVPRRRSLLLVAEAAAHAGALARRGPPVVVDLCCGSGALGAAVQARVPTAEVHGADLDPAAVECARRNLDPDRVWAGDLLEALPDELRGRVDALVVNAPYVPTAEIAAMPPEARDHEPRLALDGGPDGLDVHRRVAAAAPAWLSPEGMVVLETGRVQADRTRALLAAAGLHAEIRTDPDVGGVAVVARRTVSPG